MWFQKILVRFFMSIDKTLYNFIATLYDLLIAISRTSVLTQGDIAQFVTRIEILLSIFMLFKLSFSLITYIVNPDDFTDKQKGFGKLVQNSVISLTMLVLVPYIFQMAFSLQAKVLNNNLLAKLLLGEKITESDGTTDSKQSETDVLIDDAGEELAFMVMLPLFSPNIALTELIPCSSLYSTNNAFNEECERALKENVKDKNDNAIENYKYGIEKYSIGLTFRTEMALMVYKYDGEKFLIDYKYPLSTAVAVITCLLLITFCIDIGVRSVKLAFLQLIYPIPVISFMDPKSGKDGIFSKWYKMCLSTFLSLFIRLLALYFGIYVIMRVGRHGMVDIINGSEITNGWIKLFIVIGILMFVKQMPKILENLGIKLDGDGKFNLNPLKKLEEGALGGKVLSRVPKAAAGAAMGLGMGAVGAATGAGIGKGLSGMLSGAAAGLKGKKIGEIHKGQIDANQRMREARANGSTFFGRRGAQFSNLIGSQGKAGKLSSEDKMLEDKIKKKQEFHDSFDNMKSKISSAIEGNKLGSYSEAYQNLKAKAEAARIKRDSIKKDDQKYYYDFKTGIREDGTDIIERRFNEKAYNADVDNAARAVVDAEGAVSKYLKKDAVEQFYKAYRGGTLSENEKDSDVLRAFENLDVQARANEIGADILNSYADIKETDNKISNDINKLQGDRIRIREAKDKTSADKSALGK